MSDFLSIDHLSFRYPDYPGLAFPELFGDIYLSIGGGGLSLLLGRPESGKTTLTRILGGLVPRFTGGSISGSVILGGRDILREKPYDLLGEVGLAFQDPDEQFITTRCDTEVAFGLESLSLSRQEIKKRVLDSFASLGIEHLITRKTGELSGGEKKKLVLASIIALSPSLILLDETLEEIDEDSRISVLTLLKGMDASTLITSSRLHDFYRGYADTQFLLSSGSVLRHTPENRDDFIGRCRAEGLLFEGSDGLQGSSSAPAGAILSASALRYRYPESGFSLDVGELSVHEGELVALIGRNGSGKSTLAKILSGLIEPEEGRVRVRPVGASLSASFRDASSRDLNTFTGYVFQNPDYQIFLPTVEEELAYGLLKQGLKESEVRRRVTEAASLFRLPGLSVPPAIMSYGARKRLQAAVYYLLDRPLYILDEADSGLSFDDFLSVLSIFRQRPCGIIIITHDLALARRVSHRVCSLDRGRLEDS